MKPGTYLLIQRQARGCDYTIGCGIFLDVLEAETAEAAQEEAAKLLMEDGEDGPLGPDRENPIVQAEVVQYVGAVPLDALKKTVKIALEAEEAAAELAFKRSVFETLKTELEGK